MTTDTNASHTPGPWEKTDYLTNYLIAGGINESGHKKRVAIVDRPISGFRTSEYAANALLIAAAPDLLAACEEAVEILFNAPGGHQHVTDAMHAAIAKARGES